MTAAAPASRRPTKPRRSPLVYVGIFAFVAITLISVSDEWGIGLSIGELVANIGRGAPILRQLLSPNWEFLPRVVGPLIETFQMAVVASVIGCGIALPVSPSWPHEPRYPTAPR